MNPVTKYKVTTCTYGLCAIIGMVAFLYFAVQHWWFLTFLALLFFLVALDNVFCGDHCRRAGFPVKGHFVIPPFLKK